MKIQKGLTDQNGCEVETGFVFTAQLSNAAYLKQGR
jgi:hypothetical protein